MFLGSTSLLSAETRPDCFRTVAAEIKSSCGRHLDSDPDGKVRGRYTSTDLQSTPTHAIALSSAAIELTKCELATARLKTPLECETVHFGQDGQHSHHTDSERSQLTTTCVEALSRSTQFWATYSGYMRELPQLCFAFARLADQDVAKQIYHNITQEKRGLLNILKQHLQQSAEAREEHIARNKKDHNDLQRLYDSFLEAVQVSGSSRFVQGARL